MKVFRLTLLSYPFLFLGAASVKDKMVLSRASSLGCIDLAYKRPDPAIAPQTGEEMALLSPDGFGNALLAKGASDFFITRQMEKGYYPKDLNAFRDASGNTLLLIAIKKDFFETTMELLQLGADPSIANDKGNNALHVAAAKEEPLLLRAVLTAVGNDDHALIAQNIYRNTPLFRAAIHGCLENAEILLRYSQLVAANIDLPETHGYTALTAVTKLGNVVMLKLLISFGANIAKMDDYGHGALTYALGSRQIDLVRAMLNESTKEIITQEVRGLSLLSWALINNSIPWLIFLVLQLKLDLEVEEPIPGNQPMFPLFLAVSLGSFGLTQFLLQNGASPDPVNIEGDTPLLIAARENMANLCHVLLLHGADPQKVNPNTGDSALDLARNNHNLGLAKILSKSRKQ